MADLKPEFSHLVRLDTLGDGPRSIDLAADQAARTGLARRFGLRSIDRLDATATLTRTGEVIAVAGRIRAAVVQACVASGEDVPERIDEPFALRFVPEEQADVLPDDEVELAEDALDEVGYAGGAVDLGEAIAQTLALALNPYPRADGAEETLRAAGVKAEGEAGPFGALAGLKDLLK